MKKVKNWLIAVFMLLPMMVSAYDFKADGIYYNITSEEDLTVEVTYQSKSGYSYQGEMIIPSIVTYNEKTYSVTSIGDSACYECRSLKSITIPKSVRSIGSSVFRACISLTSVYISDIAAWCNMKLSDYQSTPFSRAEHLYIDGKKITKLIIPESVTSIGNYAFCGCKVLTSITIPESVTSIGNGAFRSCASLTSITIPESVTSIGDETFYSCI